MSDRPNAVTVFLLAGSALGLYLTYLLFRPYARPIILAGVVAIVFHPVYGFSGRLFRNRNLRALASTVFTFLITAVPLSLLGFAIAGELGNLYAELKARTGGQGAAAALVIQAAERWLAAVMSHLPVPPVDVHNVIRVRVEQLTAALLHSTGGLVTNVFSLVVDGVIALVVLFFLFRDGEAGLKSLLTMLPLPPEAGSRLRRQIADTVVANFYGGVAVAALQGFLTGLAFWVLGIDSPVLWGVITGFFSLLPIVGSAAVWVPAGVILVFTGHLTKGILLLAWGTGVVGVVDNVVRPLILRSSMRLHTLLVFFALLGGVQVFGVIGLFAGPVILSITAALISLLRQEQAARPQPASLENQTPGDSLVAPPKTGAAAS